MTRSDIFDRHLVRRRRDRAAPGFRAVDFLVREAAERLVERLLDIDRRFERVVELGCHDGLLRDILRDGLPPGRVGWLAQADLSPAMAGMAADGGPAFVADEEWLPLADASVDAVLSCLSLHWVNDLPGAFSQIRRALRPDGFFLGCLLGGETLVELREVLRDAEAEVTGGLSPRVSPVADASDAAGLLQRAGFALPVVDSDRLTVTYEHAIALMRELRAMGEANAVADRLPHPTRRTTLFRAAELYAERHGGSDGRIPATFQILWVAGWAPDESQQKPLRPGSASARLADALDAREVGTGVKPGD
jgi:NADH dehydrogenase [ubiquinone] 1 alpha subcomplex assembly factor 5